MTNITNDNPINQNITLEKPKKKRGRKSKKELLLLAQMKQEPEEPKVPKKRGRKPKGGKIIQNNTNKDVKTYIKPNVILHLRCKSEDLNEQKNFNTYDYNPEINTIENYNITNQKQGELNYEIIGKKNTDLTNTDVAQENDHRTILFNKTIITKSSNDTNNNTSPTSSNAAKKDSKIIWRKLQTLQKSLHVNDDLEKKSHCFWCTYGFDNPPIFIPKNKIQSTYSVYGCFCSPECAVSFLMKENIDQSVKFERYSLLNYLYGSIYDYEKNITPAPDPFYMLDKYYGNLSIQEYRQLLKNDRLIIVVEKPLTKVMPEIHEDNNEFNIDINTTFNKTNSNDNNKTFRLMRKQNPVEKNYFSKDS